MHIKRIQTPDTRDLGDLGDLCFTWHRYEYVCYYRGNLTRSLDLGAAIAACYAAATQ